MEGLGGKPAWLNLRTKHVRCWCPQRGKGPMYLRNSLKVGQPSTPKDIRDAKLPSQRVGFA